MSGSAHQLADVVPREGVWCRSDLLDRDGVRAAQVADVLAWAVRRGIPLADALETLPFFTRPQKISDRQSRFFRALRSPGRPFRPWFWLMNFRWSLILSEMTRDLRAGQPLSLVLERCGRNQFPGYYIHGVEHAETCGGLREALPRLAFQMSYPRRIAWVDKTGLTLGLLRCLAFGLVLTFMVVIVLPKFDEVFMDMGHGVSLAPNAGFALSVYAILFSSLAPFVCIAACLWGLSRFETFGDYFIIWMPLIGKVRKRFLLGEVVQSMCIYLEGGMDLPSAAAATATSTRSHWMSLRVEHFGDGLNQGEHWLVAWKRLGVGSEMEQWLLQNADQASGPAAGFQRVADWIHRDNMYFAERFAVQFDVATTVFFGLLVGIFLVCVFSMLVAAAEMLL